MTWPDLLRGTRVGEGWICRCGRTHPVSRYSCSRCKDRSPLLAPNEKKSSTRNRRDELVASLRLLMEVQEYSATDVGLMFGRSRERVRQWCAEYGVEQRGLRRGTNTRRWNDEQNCFEPVPGGGIRRERIEVRRRNRGQEREEFVAARRAFAIETVGALQKRLGRTPTLMEIGAELFGKDREIVHIGALLVGWWKPVRGTRESAGTLQHFRETVGIGRGSRGGPWRNRRGEAA